MNIIILLILLYNNKSNSSQYFNEKLLFLLALLFLANSKVPYPNSYETINKQNHYYLNKYPENKVKYSKLLNTCRTDTEYSLVEKSNKEKNESIYGIEDNRSLKIDKLQKCKSTLNSSLCECKSNSEKKKYLSINDNKEMISNNSENKENPIKLYDYREDNNKKILKDNSSEIKVGTESYPINNTYLLDESIDKIVDNTDKNINKYKIIDKHSNKESLADLIESTSENLENNIISISDKSIVESNSENLSERQIDKGLVHTDVIKSNNLIPQIIRNNHRGATISVMLQGIGIITGQVIFNFENVTVLKLKNNTIVFINNNCVTNFF